MPGLIGVSVNAMDDGDYTKIGWYCLIMLGVVIFAGFFTMVRGYIFNTISERIAKHLRYDIVVHLLKKDVAFFDSHKTGDILSRMSSDV